MKDNYNLQGGGGGGGGQSKKGIILQ